MKRIFKVAFNTALILAIMFTQILSLINVSATSITIVPQSPLSYSGSGHAADLYAEGFYYEFNNASDIMAYLSADLNAATITKNGTLLNGDFGQYITGYGTGQEIHPGYTAWVDLYPNDTLEPGTYVVNLPVNFSDTYNGNPVCSYTVSLTCEVLPLPNPVITKQPIGTDNRTYGESYTLSVDVAPIILTGCNNPRDGEFLVIWDMDGSHIYEEERNYQGGTFNYNIPVKQWGSHTYKATVYYFHSTANEGYSTCAESNTVTVTTTTVPYIQPLITKQPVGYRGSAQNYTLTVEATAPYNGTLDYYWYNVTTGQTIQTTYGGGNSNSVTVWSGNSANYYCHIEAAYSIDGHPTASSINSDTVYVGN